MARKKVLSLRFNTGIYKRNVIKKAITAFVDFAEFQVRNCKSYVEIRITGFNSESIDKFVGEFGNYVLGMTINARRG